MGVASRTRDIRPPLPAPTESMDEGEGTTSAYETDVATNVTTRTDKTSYEVPADGSPITIPTNKITSSSPGDIQVSKHGRHKSQTSLLIEYFEGSKTGDKAKSKPSVRVKVTPSSRKRAASGGHEAIQITGIGKDRKPSYTRRISLGGSSRNAEVLHVPPGTEGTEISQSSGSANPLEIEVLNSDVSNQSRGLMCAPNESNVSSMPPDSMLEGSNLTESELGPVQDEDDDVTVKKEDYLEAPLGSRSRSTSQDRITQKVMEKLGQTSGSKPYKSSRSRSERSLSKEYERDDYSSERRRRSSKSHRYDDDAVSGAGSDMNASQVSYRSGSNVSNASRFTNNPKMLQMVEDTVKRIILPEISAIKREQSIRSSEHSRRESYDESSGLHRRVSKSSSSPNISSRPKVVLNRDGDDPGTVLSRGDSERKQRKSSREHRPSSRRSSGSRRASYEYDDDESTVREKSSRSSHRARDAAAAGIAGGILTAGALKAHDSRSEDRDRDRDRERRRKRSSKSHGSGSRSASVADTMEDTYTLKPKDDIPPMPMASGINDSEMTRESILSTNTDPPSSEHTRTPIREVSRGSLGTPTSRTPTRTPVGGKSLGMSQSNQSIESPKSPGGRSTKDRMAALAAAGVAGTGAAVLGKEAYDRTVDADGYGDSSPSTQRKISSPVQSVSSLKNKFEESLVPSDSRPQSAASRSSAGRLRENTSARSGTSSPTSNLARSRKQSQNVGGDEFMTPLEKPQPAFSREGTPGTPVGETVDEWYDRQHKLNDRYRNSLDEEDIENRDSFTATNRDSYQTNPYPQDEKRFTQFTDDSLGVDSEGVMNAEQDVRALGANPQLMHHSFGAESNVASLMEPSFVSSDVRSSQASGQSPSKGSFAARLREMGDKDSPSGLYNGSTMSQSMPSQDRWAALSSRAKEMSMSSQGDAQSPRQSPAKTLREQESSEQPVMGASGLPVADDPLPEIGHYDDTKSEISTNPSIIQGPLGGDATGKETWPYTPEPQQRELAEKHSKSVKSEDGKSNSGLKAAAAGAGGAALAAGGAYAATHRKGSKQPMVEDEDDEQRALTPDVGRNREYIDREATPTSPAAFRDEGYVTENTRSAGALTPRAEGQYSRKDMDEYNRAMDAQDLGEEDPFVGSKQQQNDRIVSGNSHGLRSPLYDSSTGKGKDNIQSKDIVALMDHLTVRDAQRNARDTEILVSLVRSAAEMRQSFDEMKKFIVDQDRMIMADAQRGHNQIKSAVMSGPRTMPSPSTTRTPRQSDEDIQTKRKGVLKRALKGLTGSKSAKDLEKMEDMLMQILENVEDLKIQQGGVTSAGGESRGISSNTYGQTDSLDSYERLRNRPDDSGYEPEGQAGTSSTPSQSGYFATTPRAEKQQFHSGYDGRRGSENRVSTVMEGDEEELEPHESRVLDNQFERNEGFGTPTKERNRRFSPSDSPYGVAQMQPDEFTPRSADKQRKHKSNNSSIFGGIPKISRWSKTTSSSAAPDAATLDSPVMARGQRPGSQASSMREYDDDGYSLRSQGRDRSTQSLDQQQQADLERRSMRSQASRLTRTPSPLIPSEASASQRDDYEHDDRAISPVQEDAYLDNLAFDDPKYQAYRNSLPLQHPQPRKGDTDRHQNTLESQAHIYDHEDMGGSATDSNLSQRTVSDDVAMFGSSGTAALSKHRFSQMNADPMSPASMGSPRGYGAKDDAPLIPSSQQQQRGPAPAAAGATQPRTYYHDDDYDSAEDDEPYSDSEGSRTPSPERHPEPQYSNSGFSRGGYYSSPFGSGHLLEPIEEVRYSLETDSGHSPEPEAQPQVATAVDVRREASGGGGLGGRKITGPRPMNLGASGRSAGGVRRKPVGSAGDGY